MMSMVQQQSMDLAVGSEDERSLEALVMKSGGKYHLSAPSSKIDLGVNPAIDSRDGDASKPSSNKSSSNESSSDGNGNNRAEVFSNLEDYKNARAKLALLKQQKSTRSENGMRKSPSTPSRRRRRRNSHSNADKVRKQLEELLGNEEDDVDVDVDVDVDGSDHRRTKKRVSVPAQMNKYNTLSEFMSKPNKEGRQGRRSVQSATRTVTSSSTATTKKQSNRSSTNTCSVNDLVQNSAWADGVRKSSESSVPKPSRIRRARTDGTVTLKKKNSNHDSSDSLGRTRFHQQHSSYHWINTKDSGVSSSDGDNPRPSTPKSDRPTKGRLRRSSTTGDVKRSTCDASDANPALSGSRRPRRKLRRPSTGSAAPSSPRVSSKSPHSSRRRRRGSASSQAAPPPPEEAPPTPKKETEAPFSNSDSVLMTPYNVLQDKKYRSSSRSYSDLVMIAADKNKSPMASLRNILQDEKEELTASGKGYKSEGADEIDRQRSRSAGRRRRRSRSNSQSLLQIPFSEGEANTESGSEQRDESSDINTKSSLGVQAFGKSVAKSMKKQAKNTKRRISRQITNAKAATTSKSTPTSHVPLDGTVDSCLLYYGSDDSCTSDSSKKDKYDDRRESRVPLRSPSGIKEPNHEASDSPLPLKAPSGHRGWGGETHQESYSRFPKRNPNITVGVVRMSVKKEEAENPNSPLALRPPSGHVKNFSPLPLKPPSGQTISRPSSHEPTSKATEEIPQGPPLVPVIEAEEKKLQKRRKSKINRLLGLSKKNESASTYEQLNSSVGSGLYVPSKALESSSVFHPVYIDDENDIDSSVSFTVKKPDTGIQFALDGDSVEHSISFHKPMNGSFGHGSINSFEKEDLSVTQKTEPLSSHSNRPISCKQIYPLSDRDSSVSTIHSSLPASPKNTSEKSYQSQIQNVASLLAPNLNASADDRLLNSAEFAEDVEVPIKGAADEQERIATIDSMLEPVHDDDLLADVLKIKSESGFHQNGSKEKGDDALSRTKETSGTDLNGSEVSKSKKGSRHQRRVDDDPTTEQEIFNLLRKESRKIRTEGKERRSSSSGRAGRQNKESRKLRYRKQQHIVDMDITVNSDPLELSEISGPNPHNIYGERKKPAKSQRSSFNRSDSRGKTKSGDRSDSRGKTRSGDRNDSRGKTRSGDRSNSRGKTRTRDRSDSSGKMRLSDSSFSRSDSKGKIRTGDARKERRSKRISKDTASIASSVKQAVDDYLSGTD